MTQTKSAKTATLASINNERPDGTFYDVVVVHDAEGAEIDSFTVESTEDEAPYDAALIANGHSDAEWTGSW